MGSVALLTREGEVKIAKKIEEGEREILVEDYHERAGIELPNAHVHAAIHVVVENQIAMGEELYVFINHEMVADIQLERSPEGYTGVAIGLDQAGDQSTLIFDSSGPRDCHVLTDATQLRSVLLKPSKRRIKGPRPEHTENLPLCW